MPILWRKSKVRLDSINLALDEDKRALEIQADSARKELANIQTRVSALNRQERALMATIDSLNIRSIILANFRNLDSARYANVLEKYKMILENNYYVRSLNPNGAGIDNNFKLQPGDSIVYDAATGLYWQQSGSGRMNSPNALKYVAQLNAEKYGGYSDWRLPTLKEAMSLMEPKKMNGDLYIDPVFDAGRRWIWTADKYPAWRRWVASFIDGRCFHLTYSVGDGYVRAVR